MPATTDWMRPGGTVIASSSTRATRSPTTASRSLGSRVGRASRPRIAPWRSTIAARSVRPPASMPTTKPASSSSSTRRGGRPTPVASIEYSRRIPRRRIRSTTRPTVAAESPVSSANRAREARGCFARTSRTTSAGSDILRTKNKSIDPIVARSKRGDRLGLSRRTSRCYQHRDEKCSHRFMAVPSPVRESAGRSRGRDERQEAAVAARVVGFGPLPGQVVARHLRGVLIRARRVRRAPDG